MPTRISTHPTVNFTIVINPGNGPGPDDLPDANYTRAIPTLSSYANVRLLGYVHTSYTTRNAAAVYRDIKTYAEWPTKSANPNLAVQGIFFDETPQQYSAHSLAYLQNLTQLTKGLNGLGSNPYVSSPFFLLHPLCVGVRHVTGLNQCSVPLAFVSYSSDIISPVSRVAFPVGWIGELHIVYILAIAFSGYRSCS